MVILFLLLAVVVPLALGVRLSRPKNDASAHDSSEYAQRFRYEPTVEIRSRGPRSRVSVDEEWARRREDPALQKYGDMLNRHIELTRQINKEYSAARFESKDLYSPRMEHVVELCQEDILLADQYRQYLNEIKRLPSASEKLYPSFRRLAIIYENRKDYEGAIAVCEYAMDSGFFLEENGKTVEDRLIRLQAKLRNAVASSNSPESSSEDIV